MFNIQEERRAYETSNPHHPAGRPGRGPGRHRRQRRDDTAPQWHQYATSRISIDENQTQARYEHDQYHGAFVFAANDWGGDYRLVNYRIVQAGVPGWSLEVRRTHYTGNFNYKYFNLVYDGTGMDHETQDRTTLTVRATDGGGNHSDHTITVRVNDIDEIPGAPGSVAVLPRTGNRIIVRWQASDNSGPPVTRYEVDWKTGDGDWKTPDQYKVANHPKRMTRKSLQRIDSEVPVTARVRAVSDEGPAAGPKRPPWNPWSSPATPTP